MLHYFVKNFFSDIVVSPCLNNSTLTVFYMEEEKPSKHSKSDRKVDLYEKSDKLNNVFKMNKNTNEQLTIQCYSWDSLDKKKEWKMYFNKVGLSSAHNIISFHSCKYKYINLISFLLNKIRLEISILFGIPSCTRARIMATYADVQNDIVNQ